MSELETAVSQDGAQAEPVLTTEVTEQPEVQAEPTETTEVVAEAEPEPEKPKPRAKEKNWAEKRLAEVTWQREEAKRETEALRTELAAAKALVEAANRGEAIQGEPKPALSDQEVQRRAEQIVNERQFRDAVTNTIKAGTAEFPEDFNYNCGILADLGANERPEFMQSITDSDICQNGHKVLQYLGQNPEEADALLRMSPAKMAAKIAMLSDKIAKPKPIPVSSAPAPIKPIDGRARGEGDPEKMSDEEFDKFYGAKLTALRAR